MPEHALPDDVSTLPVCEFAFPGPLRDQLVGAVLSGAKTASASLLEEHRREGSALPEVGELAVVVDSDDRPVCVLRTTGVQIVPLGRVSDAHARGEGEGYPDAIAWREGHEEFWTSPQFIAATGSPRIELDDETEVVCETFEVARRL